MSDYVLGLDLGPNSIGWAMLEARVDDDQGHWTHEALGFLDTSAASHPPLGVRVFEAGLALFDTAKEESLCQKRRSARSLRRNHRRRNDRRRELRRLLKDWGLLPPPGAEREALFCQDPYELRAKALDQALSGPELARVLVHLSQRRGFKSNRKSGQAKEDRGMLKEIGELAQAIQASGARTLGEYFHQQRQGRTYPERVRAIHTRRDMYEAEFAAIREAQEAHHPLDQGQWEALHHLIFRQMDFEVTPERRAKTSSRANLHRAPSVRRCPLVPGERCCHRGKWIAQEFRLLKELNNLRLRENHGPERDPTPEEREILLAELHHFEERKFSDLKKALHRACDTDLDVQFNLERGERKKLDGNRLEAKLRKAFSPKQAATPWHELPEETKVQLRMALIDADDDTLLQQLREAGLNEETAQSLASWAPSDGYLGYSEAALTQLVPHLLAGKNEWEAIQAAFPNRAEGKAFDTLPALNSKELPDELSYITNPVVNRALVEVRKVINMLVREHGKPARIIVEMARNMKDNSEGRKKASKKMREREQDRNRAREAVEALIGAPCSRRDVDRYLMWEAQNHLCLYTGRAIPQAELFNGEWEVDHILPHWRSLDDSFPNKALVHRSANADKGNRTVVEWLGETSEAYRKLMQRADGMKLSGGTLKRLQTQKLDVDSFAERQLNDTRYISKMVVKYLELLYEPERRTGEKAVQSTRGGLTAELRRRWGLNGLLEPLTDLKGVPYPDPSGRVDENGEPLKSRADHRHHAVDAIVVALSSRRYLKRYQDYWKIREQPGAEAPELELPWEDLRLEAKAHLEQVIVSHRPMRKLLGALHEETFYGQSKDGTGKAKAGVFTTRKGLDQLTPNMLKQIRGKDAQKAVRHALETKGWSGTGVFPKDWWVDGIRHPNGLPIRKVRIEVTMKDPVPLGPEQHRFAKGGSNHHIEFWEGPDKKGRPTLKVRTISTLEAATRARRQRRLGKDGKLHGQDPVQRKGIANHRFLFSLARKDSVLIRNGEKEYLAVVTGNSGPNSLGSKMDTPLRDVRDSRPDSQSKGSPLVRISSTSKMAQLRAQKVQVDPLGRVFPAGD